MNRIGCTHLHQQRRLLVLTESIAQHRNYLFNYALGRLRNRELAEDAMQDSFLAALAGGDKFLGKSSQRTWITSILKHKVCDEVRRRCRDRAIFKLENLSRREEFNSLVGHPSAVAATDPSTELDRKELRDAIEQAISELPKRFEKVFSLYESGEWTGREICAELGISQNNFWLILHRARKQLREQLSHWQVTTRSSKEPRVRPAA